MSGKKRMNTSMETFLGVCILVFFYQSVCQCSYTLEEYQADVCFYGDTDLEILDETYPNCLDACRARVTCTAITMHTTMHICGLHFDDEAIQMECPASDFMYSTKKSWKKKQLETCICPAGLTCYTVSHVCEMTECRIPEPIANGNILGNQRYVGAKIMYDCNYGYQLVGARSSRCLADGLWNHDGDALPSCGNGFKACTSLAPPGNNTNTPTVHQTLPGSTFRYQCLAGYYITFEQDLTLTCTEQGQWGIPPTCWKVPVTACHAVAPTGTNTVDPIVESQFPGTVITYKCKMGYVPEDASQMNLTCSDDGSWGSPPTCVTTAACDAVAPSGTNTVDPIVGSLGPGTVITYKCLTGYVPEDASLMNLTCSVDGSWGSPPTCVTKACDAVSPTGTNTVDPIVESRGPGTVITYTCLTGYVPDDASKMNLTCSVDGSWGSPPTCVKTDCDAVAPTGTNTVDPIVESQGPGTVITYKCKVGYVPEDASQMNLTCSDDGSWRSPPTCVTTGQCAPPWTMVGGRCRLYVANSAYWPESQTHCETLGGNLTHIYSEQDIMDIKSFVCDTCYAWTGINDRLKEGQFIGVAGQSVPPKVVELLKLNNEDRHDCAIILSSNLYMDDCYSHTKSICEK